MSREVRKVPANWKHPKDPGGDYLSLHDSDYESELAKWEERKRKWELGLRPELEVGNADYRWVPRDEWKSAYKNDSFEDYFGEAPDPDYYRPKWSDEERTHFQMYETVSEGSPLSPPLPSLEELARWCADNKADAGGTTATYEQWLAMCKAGSCPSLLVIGGRVLTGVEASELR